MPRIQESKLNKGHLRKLKALRTSLGKKIADEAFSKWLKELASEKKTASTNDPVAARIAGCINKEDKKKPKLKLPRGGYLVRRGFQGAIVVEAAPAKPIKRNAAAKPKKRSPAAKNAAPKKAAPKKR